MFTGIRLQHFRSYKESSFDLNSGVNVVVGPNASGKTNLLEAIYIAARGSSFRTKADIELIRHREAWLRIDALSPSANRTIKVRNNMFGKEFTVGSHSFKRLPYKFHLPVVLFVPEQLRLIHGSPSLRRDFIDHLLTQIDPNKKNIYRRYARALQQRNRMLKQHNPSADEQFVWAVKLAEYGSQIAQWRIDLVRDINRNLDNAYAQLSNDAGKIAIDYISVLPAASYKQKLMGHLQSKTDIRVGFTTCGPHRDDLLVTMKGQPAQMIMSRGETRSLVIALKMIEAKLILSATNIQPLLLFDDVFSELDGIRRDRIASIISDQQALITTTDADSIAIRSFKDAQFIAI